MLMRVETGEGVCGNSIILAICLYICKSVKKNSLSLKNVLETKQGSYFLFVQPFSLSEESTENIEQGG